MATPSRKVDRMLSDRSARSYALNARRIESWALMFSIVGDQ